MTACNGLGEFAERADLLEAAFGRWPCFHDAEIVDARVAADDAAESPVLHLDIRLHEMTDEVEVGGHYVLRNVNVATFEFTRVRLHRWSGLRGQNVIDDPFCERVQDARDGLSRYLVKFPCITDCELEFTCAAIRVVRVQPAPPKA